MVTIGPLDPDAARPTLGRESRFAARGDVFARVEYFLEHQGVMYPRPLRTEADGSVRVYPEAPGRYALHASWQTAGNESGWARTDFDVGGAAGHAPERIRVAGETLWVPSAWDAQLLGSHERPVFNALRETVRPGAVVYDIGANVGVFSVHLARWAGASGWLYAVEPSPTCVYFLRSNLAATRLSNFTILPIAVSNQPGELVFSVNYGSSLVGAASGDSTPIDKPGHRIGVDGDALDAVIQRFHLRRPDFLKLDVEGAEVEAVEGMMGTLRASRPGLLIELHGRTAARATLQTLAELDYRYAIPAAGSRFATAHELADAIGDECVQVLGNPSR
jgi:FkbM family methyltransferase